MIYGFCRFNDCDNSLDYLFEHPLADTFCRSCIEKRFRKTPEGYKPVILDTWIPRIDKEAKRMALAIGRKDRVDNFKDCKIVYDSKRFGNLNKGASAMYRFDENNYPLSIHIYLRKHKSEMDFVQSYMHEVAHHYNPEVCHAKPFQDFLCCLTLNLDLKPVNYSTYKNGKINFAYAMEVEVAIPKIVIPTNPLPFIFSKGQWETYYLKEIKELDTRQIATIRECSESNIRDSIMQFRKKISEFEKSVKVYSRLDTMFNN